MTKSTLSQRTETPRQKRGGGRPLKFGEPSRPVTLTLPERVLELLSKVDADRARAVTKIADRFAAERGGAKRDVEVIPVAPGRAVVLVPDSRNLRSIPWLHLIEIAPARHLLALADKTSIEKLEVTLVDLLELVPGNEKSERKILSALLECLREPRRRQTAIKEEIIVLEPV